MGEKWAGVATGGKPVLETAWPLIHTTPSLVSDVFRHSVMKGVLFFHHYFGEGTFATCFLLRIL